MNNSLMSDQIDQLATALAKAQAEMLVAGKNQRLSHLKSNYADFESIVEASRPALTKHGLSVVQSPNEEHLITILMHSSGQWIKSTAKYNPIKSDIQSLSAYNTYLKRMCYTSLIGVVTGELDDDGNAASSNGNGSYSSYNQRSHTQSPITQAEVELITKEQLEQLEDAFMGHAEGVESIKKELKIDRLDQVPKSKFLAVFKYAQKLSQV